jgi:homogentisate 1,2-dioxygenase
MKAIVPSIFTGLGSASHADLSRVDHVRDTMAFMFETRSVIRPTAQAMGALTRQTDYQDCWAGLGKHFHVDAAE